MYLELGEGCVHPGQFDINLDVSGILKNVEASMEQRIFADVNSSCKIIC